MNIIYFFKNLFFVLIFSVIILAVYGLLSETLFAQDRTGSISGSVIDKSTGKALEGADISLFRQKDSSLVKGASTDASGNFSVDVPFGRYYLRANIVGYNFAVISGIAVNPNSVNVTLDPVKLSSSSTTTEEIVVEGEKSMIEFRPDKKVFNVSKNMTSQGGTLIDLLKEIPSVTVDQDNNVSLRGSEGVKIMIDGRPSGLDGSNRTAILEQLPASDVESIELITNPSAKYEAEGSSGIINIVLKKNQDKSFGYNGTLGLNLGTGDKYDGQFSLSLKNNKLNVTGNYSYNSRNLNTSGLNSRYNFINSNQYFTDVTNTGRRHMNGQNFKIGLDYNINPLNTFGLIFSYRKSDRSRSDIGSSEEFDLSGLLTSKYYNNVISNDDGYNYSINANYTLRFKKPQQILTADFSLERDDDDDFTNTYDTYIMPVNNSPLNRKEFEKELDDSYSGQIDYVHPFSKDAKFETGVKTTYKKRDNDFSVEEFDYNSNQFIPDLNSNNRFIYKELINAAYLIYTNKIGDFGFSLGTRVEQTQINGELVNPAQLFDKSYVDFFPSASISQKLSKSSEVQLSYARRVNRPRLRMLNPFVSISMMGGSNSLHKGNPELNPEFTDSYELSYIQYLPFATVTPSIFYRYTTDDISRSRVLLDSITTLTTFVNYNSSKSYGGEMIVTAQPLKFWSVNGTFSYFKTEVDGSNINSTYTNNGYSWSARAMSNLFLPSEISLQLSYFYSGKRVSAQGTFEPFQFFDAAVKKDFFDKRVSLSLRVSDILNTAKFRANIFGENFTEIFERRRDSRTFFLNISYKFGKQEKRQQDRKKRDNNRDNNGDDGFDF